MLIVSPRGWIFSHPFHTTGEAFLLILAETKDVGSLGFRGRVVSMK